MSKTPQDRIAALVELARDNAMRDGADPVQATMELLTAAAIMAQAQGTHNGVAAALSAALPHACTYAASLMTPPARH